jgi:enterochelin esterase-like enzyme
MSAVTKASRTQLWMESLGDWSWPGQGGVALEAPPWVPAFPPRRDPAVVRPVPAHTRRRGLARLWLLGVLLSALGAVCVALVLHVRLPLQSHAPVLAARPQPGVSVQPLPTLRLGREDAAGSRVAASSYPSVALGHRGSFLVYLPPGYKGASTSARYPVLYLLHGNDQPASTFLQMGLQGELDRLIARHTIPPLIAVMIQGGSGANNWRNIGSMHYESYVLEVQELVDRMLPTIPERGARAIAGDSMGGYGAMNLTLGNPYRFGVVESWLGFFNGLGGQLDLDRPVIAKLGLHAFIYGGASDDIANPSEDAPFAAALRGAGAEAKSAIYPGEHTVETLQAHLRRMLTFAGQSMTLPTGDGAR